MSNIYLKVTIEKKRCDYLQRLKSLSLGPFFYYLTDPVNVKMLEKNGIKTINFCKMVVDFFI